MTAGNRDTPGVYPMAGPTARSETGTGSVRINGTAVYALWVYEYVPEPAAAGGPAQRGRRWRVRMSVDEYDALGVHPYQRVRLQLPRRGEESVYFKAERASPPWVWLEFDTDVRR
jgi:hypothetical protein